MKLTLAISPCPNDTFIFDAIIHHRIDLKGYDFEVHFHDVEELNKSAAQEVYDVTKLSYFALLGLEDQYRLLDSGGALGHGCGPLLVSASPDVKINGSCMVAVPGLNTTANFLLTMAYPELTHKKEVLFSEIEDAVASGACDLGLMIHESRFTYTSKGLFKVKDLGEYWEETTACPIPLGAIAIRKKYDEKTAQDIEQLVKESVAYAFQHPDVSRSFVKTHAQEMNDEVINAHIALYVNEYSLSLGTQGRKAVELFRKRRLQQEEISN